MTFHVVLDHNVAGIFARALFGDFSSIRFRFQTNYDDLHGLTMVLDPSRDVHPKVTKSKYIEKELIITRSRFSRTSSCDPEYVFEF